MDDPSLRGLRSLAGRCDLLLCDIYGTLDDGVSVFPEAADALGRFRAAGGAVILVSNSSMPGQTLADQLYRRGLPYGAHDGVVTSADVARSLLLEREVTRAHHIGTPADLALFDGLGIAVAEVEDADVVVCTAYPITDPLPTLVRARAAGLDLVCTNPDISVAVADRVLRFAGFVAQSYRDLGGRVLETGKPAEAIYAAAIAYAATITGRTPAASDRVTGIGDSYDLDVAGALARGYRSVWVDGSDRATPSGSLGAVERLPRLSW